MRLDCFPARQEREREKRIGSLSAVAVPVSLNFHQSSRLICNKTALKSGGKVDLIFYLLQTATLSSHFPGLGAPRPLIVAAPDECLKLVE